MKSAYNYGLLGLQEIFSNTIGNISSAWYYSDKRIFFSGNKKDIIVVLQSNIGLTKNVALIFRINPSTGEYASYAFGVDPLSGLISGGTGTSFFSTDGTADAIYLTWYHNPTIDKIIIPFGYTNSKSFYYLSSSHFSMPATHPLNSAATLTQSFIDLTRNLRSGLYVQSFPTEDRYYSLTQTMPGESQVSSVFLGVYPSGQNPYNFSQVSSTPCVGNNFGFEGGTSGTDQNTICNGLYEHTTISGPLFAYSPRIWVDGSKVDLDPLFPPQCYTFSDAYYNKIGLSWSSLPNNVITRSAGFLGLNDNAQTPVSCSSSGGYASIFDVDGNISFISLSGYVGALHTISVADSVYGITAQNSGAKLNLRVYDLAPGYSVPGFSFGTLAKNVSEQHNLVNMVRPISIKGDFKA